MPVIVKYGDITKYKGNAIVNSLGSRYEIPGLICSNILKKVNDDNIRNFILNQELELGEIKITDAGSLPSQKIIHIVTPFKFYDTEDNTDLKSSYARIIKLAINNEIKDIAIPLIGAGANGYSEGDSFKALMDVAQYILNREEKEDRDIIKITIVPFDKNKKDCDLEKSSSNKSFEPEEKFEKILYAPSIQRQKNEIMENTLKIMKALNSVDEDEMLVPSFKKYNYPFDFVVDYLLQNHLDEKILAEGTLGRKRKSRLKSSKNISKKEVFALAFICKMNFSLTVQFMMVAGHNFSPKEELDMFYLDYLLGEYDEVETLVDLDILAYDAGIDIQFTYNKEG